MSSATSPNPELLDKVINLAKRRGFVFQSAEIYGGFRSTYDYGPLGVNMLRNVKAAWWRDMVQMRLDVVGIDAAILGPPAVWAASGTKLEYFDQATNERYTPYVIEPAAGATRAMMAFLLAAYHEDEVEGETRTVLRLDWRLAPYQVAVLPLSKKPELEGVSREVLAALQPHYSCDYDVTQSIGRRYRRQDEVGTPWCVTVDFDSLEDRCVTVRDRDSTEQVRIPIEGLLANLRERSGQH